MHPTSGFPGLDICSAAPIENATNMALCKVAQNSGCPHALLLKDLKLCRHPNFHLFLNKGDGKKIAGPDKRVMIVDDDPTILLIAGAVLRNAGYEVMEAQDGERALHVLEEWHHLPVDLVIADMQMPGISGLVLSENVMGSRPSTKVLLISGYPKAELNLKPGVPFLEKPFSSVVLLKEVVALIGKVA
jgi:CheY-like chemotaxis protein